MLVSVLLSMILLSTSTNMVHAVEVTATIPVGAKPQGITYDSGKGEMFIANYGSNTVTAISDRTDSVVATVPVGVEPIDVAYDSGKGEVFVTNDGSGTVFVISDTTNAVVANVAVGVNPVGVAYDSGMSEVFVANWGSNTVSVISDNTNTVVATISLSNNSTDQPHPLGVAYDSVMSEIYVVNSYPDTSAPGKVSVISDSNNTILTSIPVGVNPYYAVYDSGKREVFVTNYQDDFVSVISDSTKTVVANVALPANGAYASAGITYDSAKGEIFVVNQAGNVFVLSDSPNAFVKTLTLGSFSSCLGAAYDPDKEKIIVSNGDNNTVSVLSNPSSTLPLPMTIYLTAVVAVAVIIALGVAFVVRKRSKIDSEEKRQKRLLHNHFFYFASVYAGGFSVLGFRVASSTSK